MKLAAPRPSRQPIHRPRVVALLSGALDARLALVSAPPGFGKTTALIDWLADSGLANVWLSLDEADNDPRRFLRYLWAGAATLAGQDITGIGDSAGSVDGGDVAGEVALLLGELPQPSILVLDDYHVISAPTVHRAVGLLLERLPPHAHLVIATREDPILPLARLRARAELVEVRADALRFSADEARSLLVERMGIALSDDDLATLMARTEGWPAVLQLAGLSLAGRSDVSRRVRAFAASHRYVLDYITDEVVSRLDDADRDFLAQTSVLDRMTGPLCDALTGRSDGQATLERLEQANVLLVPLDDERRWYRYHRLFGDLLCARLTVADPSRPAELHLRAAAWYAKHGFHGDAAEHALRSGNIERARDHIADAAGHLVYDGEFETLLGLLDRLPETTLRSDYLLSTFWALATALGGRTEGVESHLADAEAALPAAAADRKPGSRVLPAYFALIRSKAALLGRDVPAAIAHAQEALVRAEGALALGPSEADSVVVDAVIAAAIIADGQSTLGQALVDAGDIDRAFEAYRAALPAERAAGNWTAVGAITHELARLEARRGRAREALAACDAELRDFVAAGRDELPAAGLIHLARAEILDQRGDSGAIPAAERALELARRGGYVASVREARGLLDRASARRLRALPETRLVEGLTPRELEVLRLVAAGRSNRQIAAGLYVTVSTVKTHVHTLSGKLGASSRTEAVARARELGLL